MAGPSDFDAILDRNDPWGWRSDMDRPGGFPLGGQPRQASLSAGPALSAYDNIRNKLYELLGGKPENAWSADKLATLADVGTLGIPTSIYDGAKEVARGGSSGQLAMALMPGMKPVGAAAKAVAPVVKEVVQGIKGYHGSPYDFEKFDLSKIGTGQGASASGRGVNIALYEDLATKYRDLLSVPKGAEPMLFEARAAKQEAGGDPARAEAILRERLSGADLEEAAKYLSKEPGHMYEVMVRATPEQFLDLDAPLYKQSDAVQSALKSLGVWRESPGFTVTPSKKGDKWTARNVYGEAIGTYKDKVAAEKAAMKRRDAHQKGAGLYAYTRLGGNTVYGNLDDGSAASKLMDHGVVGVRSSTGTPDDRIVVFNPDIVEILRKYGLAGLMLGGVYQSQSANDILDAEYSRKD